MGRMIGEIQEGEGVVISEVREKGEEDEREREYRHSCLRCKVSFAFDLGCARDFEVAGRKCRNSGPGN